MKCLTLLIASICLFATTAKSAPFTPESILPVGADSSISINPYTGESGDTRKGQLPQL